MEDKLAIVVCLHGDESLCLEIGNRLQNKFPVFIGNPEAIKQNKRFIAADMNRVFPGKEDGNYEEKEAFQLLNQIRKFDYVADIHTTTSKTELFGIITKPTNYNIDFAKKLGLKIVLFMTEKLAKGGALIDHHKGAISLEFGPHDDKETAEEVVRLIEKFPNNKNEIKIFEAFDLVKCKDDDREIKYHIENLKGVKKGDLIAEGKEKYYAEFDFVPFFVGETSYQGILCLAAREIK